MTILERLIEIVRKKSLDNAKAQDYLASLANEKFRDSVAQYDAFVPQMLNIKEPALSIGTAKDSLGNDIPARLELNDAACHWLIQGGTGTGKTSFATFVLAEMLSLGQPVGVVDCKSGFFGQALRWAGALAYRMAANERASFIRRIAVVNPFSNELVPLNICRSVPGTSNEVQAYEVSLTLARLFDSSMGFHMENILRNLLLLLMESELSLVEAPVVLQDDVLRGILTDRSKNRALKEFFFRIYPELAQISKDALLARLQSLLLPENLRLMLGADDLIDLKSILDDGAPLFIFLGKGPGVPEEQVDVIGSLILQLLFQAAFADMNNRKPYQIILDEFFHLLQAPALGRRFETGLTSLRSYNVMLSLVMHNFSQVSPSLRETILGNCDVMAIFRTSTSNARFFGDFVPDLDPELIKHSLRKSGKAPTKQELHAHVVEQLQRLPNRHCYFYDRRKPYRAVHLQVPDLPKPNEAIGVPAKILDEFIEAHGVSKGGFAVSKDVLCRQIETRERRLRELVRPPIRIEESEPRSLGEGNGPKGKGKRKPKIG